MLGKGTTSRLSTASNSVQVDSFNQESPDRKSGECQKSRTNQSATVKHLELLFFHLTDATQIQNIAHFLNLHENTLQLLIIFDINAQID